MSQKRRPQDHPVNSPIIEDLLRQCKLLEELVKKSKKVKVLIDKSRLLMKKKIKFNSYFNY